MNSLAWLHGTGLDTGLGREKAAFGFRATGDATGGGPGFPAPPTKRDLGGASGGGSIRLDSVSGAVLRRCRRDLDLTSNFMTFGWDEIIHVPKCMLKLF